ELAAANVVSERSSDGRVLEHYVTFAVPEHEFVLDERGRDSGGTLVAQGGLADMCAQTSWVKVRLGAQPLRRPLQPRRIVKPRGTR
ncbi:hypothetical protein AAHH79_35645, partial [Burkholderia pseudomallei]